jgi:hydrogenase maturation protease
VSDVPSYWEELERPGPDAVTVDGVELRARSRVRLRPRAGGDVMDLALSGRTAEVEPLRGEDAAGGRGTAVAHRVLVAGIGNVFLGDDGFGVALADRVARRELPAGVEVVDYGIRGMDLAYALHDGWDAVVLLDATPRGGAPGTLYVIEPDLSEGEPGVDAHGMNPLAVLALARALGGPLPRILVVGCEPQTVMRGDEEDVVAAISEPVRAALDEGVRVVEALLAELTSKEAKP